MSDDDASERTCYVSNLHPNVTQSILEELFIQMGPVEKVIIPDTKGYRYAFVVFRDPESVIFASKCLSKIPLYGMEISVRPRSHTVQEREYKKVLANERKQRDCLDYPSPVPYNNSHGKNYQMPYGLSQSDRRDRGTRNLQNLVDITPSTSRVSKHGEGARSHMYYPCPPYSESPPSYRQSRYPYGEDMSPGIFRSNRQYPQDYSTHSAYTPLRAPPHSLGMMDIDIMTQRRRGSEPCNNNFKEIQEMWSP